MKKSSVLFLSAGLGIAAVLAFPSAARSDGKDSPAPASSAPAKKAGTLKVGDPAPAISAETWVKGDPVPHFEAGKVYVVEFWATWCGPCKESIPHLTEVQKKFKGSVTVIGVASYERPGKQKDDRLEKVQKFVKDQGDNMAYTVAYESKDSTGKAWMDAANQNGIPYAFVVGGDGKIAWMGYPMDKGFEKHIQNAIKAAKGSAPKSGETKQESATGTPPAAPGGH